MNRGVPPWALTLQEMAWREVVWFLNGAVSLPDCESSRSGVYESVRVVTGGGLIFRFVAEASPGKLPYCGVGCALREK
jgi:hypothetical protein